MQTPRAGTPPPPCCPRGLNQITVVRRKEGLSPSKKPLSSQKLLGCISRHLNKTEYALSYTQYEVKLDCTTSIPTTQTTSAKLFVKAALCAADT